MTVSDLLEQPCNKSDHINKVVYKLLTTIGVRGGAGGGAGGGQQPMFAAN